mgnify:CR=1 FL=1
MEIFRCPACNHAYDDNPNLYENGVVQCPNCHHKPYAKKSSGMGFAIIVMGIITFFLAWLLNPVLSEVGWILAALITFVLTPIGVVQTNDTQNLRVRQQVEQQDFLSRNNIRRSAEYTYQDKLNSKKIRFIVDKSKQKIHISETSGKFKEYAFKDILGCEIVADSQVTGGIKRAIVGGVLAGDAGAVVGAVTAKPHIMSYKLVLYLRNISAPKVEIELITQKTKTKDTDYTNAVAFAENVVATVKAILASVT